MGVEVKAFAGGFFTSAPHGKPNRRFPGDLLKEELNQVEW